MNALGWKSYFKMYQYSKLYKARSILSFSWDSMRSGGLGRQQSGHAKQAWGLRTQVQPTPAPLEAMRQSSLGGCGHAFSGLEPDPPPSVGEASCVLKQGLRCLPLSLHFSLPSQFLSATKKTGKRGGKGPFWALDLPCRHQAPAKNLAANKI